MEECHCVCSGCTRLVGLVKVFFSDVYSLRIGHGLCLMERLVTKSLLKEKIGHGSSVVRVGIVTTSLCLRGRYYDLCDTGTGRVRRLQQRRS